METVFLKNKINKTLNLTGKNHVVVIFVTESVNNHLTINLQSSQNVKILILAILNKNSKCKIKTVQNHCAKGSISTLLAKSVLFDNADLNFEGLIKIAKSAQKSDAYLKSDVLILSDQATCKNQPNLEIKAHDVSCTHAVSAGQINKEQFFYLTSRGLNQKQAERLIVEGFFNPLLDEIPNSDILEVLKNNIAKVLHEKFSDSNQSKQLSG